MKISARNVLKGTVKKITPGSVNVEVAIEISEGVEVTSIITMESLRSLDLKEGDKAYAVIKASNIMIGV